MKLKGGQEVVQNRGPASSGASSAWFREVRVRNGAPGCIRELSGSVSGSFRSSEIGSRGAFGILKSALRALRATVSVACSISKRVFSIAERKRFAETCALIEKGWTHAAWIEARMMRLRKS